MINIKNFDSSLLKIDKISLKKIGIYYIGYIAMKNSDYINIHSVKILYRIIGEADGYIKEKKWKEILNFCFYKQKQRSIKNVHRTLK